MTQLKRPDGGVELQTIYELGRQETLSEVRDLLRGLRREVFATPMKTVPGVVAAVAYTSGDAVGTKFSFEVPKKGYIHSIVVADMDKEQLEFDVILFEQDFTGGADNVAFDMEDADGRRWWA